MQEARGKDRRGESLLDSGSLAEFWFVDEIRGEPSACSRSFHVGAFRVSDQAVTFVTSLFVS